MDMNLGLKLNPLPNRVIDLLEYQGTEYGELPEPIVLVGDFEIEIEFSTTVSGEVYPRLFDSPTAPDTALYFRESNNDGLRFRIGAGNYCDNLTTINDGKLHTVLISRVGDTFSFAIDNGTPVTRNDSIASVTIAYVGNNVDNDRLWKDGTIKSLIVRDYATEAQLWQRDTLASLEGTGGTYEQPMLAFDGATSYGELPEPWVSTDGNWTAEIVFSTTLLATPQIIFDMRGTISGVYGTPGIVFGFNAADSCKIWYEDATTVRQVNFASSGANDGNLHTIKLVNTAGSQCELFYDNVSVTTSTPVANSFSTNQLLGRLLDVGTSYNFTGTIKSIQLTDLTTPANSRTYNLDSESTTYELPDGESLGGELVVNGDASDTTSVDSSISALAGFGNLGTHDANNKTTIESGQFHLVSDGTYTGISQDILEVGKTYEININILSISGTFILAMSGDTISSYSTSGLKSVVFTTTSSTFVVKRGSVLDVTFDNISVREIPTPILYNNVASEDWTTYTVSEDSRNYQLTKADDTYVADRNDSSNTNKRMTLNNVTLTDWTKYRFDRGLNAWVNRNDSNDIIYIA